MSRLKLIPIKLDPELISRISEVAKECKCWNRSQIMRQAMWIGLEELSLRNALKK